jgi:hypothetical protein
VRETKTTRDKYLKKKYNLTSKQWDKIYERQGGRCPICLGPLRKPGNKEGKPASAVDHDHKSGRVRGIVDYYCNRRIIGRYRETTKLKRLVAYLESSFDGRLL